MHSYNSKEQQISQDSKPNCQPPLLYNIPVQLRELHRWVLWQWELQVGRWTKVPYSAVMGDADFVPHRAKCNNPNSWASLPDCLCLLKQFDGLGFMLGDEFTGIDLDKCCDVETGELEQWAREIIDQVGSYTEISPSGTGVKILVNAQKPEGRCRTGKFEIYNKGRFFTITGRHVKGTPASIEERQEAINRLHARMFPPKERPEPSTNGHAHLPDATEAEILQLARTASNSQKFNSLWAGEWEFLGYPSQSEADEALVSLLAFWTGPDEEKIDQLFRGSGLYREKWERRDYRERTISRVLESQRDYYSWNGSDLHYLGELAQEVVGVVEIPFDENHDWPEPQELIRRRAGIMPFPIEVVKDLVPAYHEICTSIAEIVQVPIDVPALMGLSVMGLPLAGRVRVAIRPDKYVLAAIEESTDLGAPGRVYALARW